jgi:hypothetical protein
MTQEYPFPYYVYLTTNYGMDTQSFKLLLYSVVGTKTVIDSKGKESTMAMVEHPEYGNKSIPIDLIDRTPIQAMYRYMRNIVDHIAHIDDSIRFRIEENTYSERQKQRFTKVLHSIEDGANTII